MIPKDVLTYWFKELTPKDWFGGGEKLDREISERFGDLQSVAAQGGLASWRTTAENKLAEIIVLDQFSRNIHRGKPEAFACDPLALRLAQAAVKAGEDKKLSLNQRSFLYMPYMHSESPEVHEEAVKLFSVSGLEYNLDYEKQHKKIIDQFGRYPHRNKVLGRQSTPEEIEFLKQPGSSF